MKSGATLDPKKSALLKSYCAYFGLLLFFIAYLIINYYFFQSLYSILLVIVINVFCLILNGVFTPFVWLLRNTRIAKTPPHKVFIFGNFFVLSSFMAYMLFFISYSTPVPITGLYGFRLGEVVAEGRLSEAEKSGMTWRAREEGAEQNNGKRWAYQLTDPMQPETIINLYLHPDDSSLMRIEVKARAVGVVGNYERKELGSLKDSLKEEFDAQYDWPLRSFDLRDHSSISGGQWVEWYREKLVESRKGYSSWTDGNNDKWMEFYDEEYRTSLRIVLQDTVKIEKWAEIQITEERKKAESLHEYKKKVTGDKVSRIMGRAPR